jgi:hypothetical protein
MPRASSNVASVSFGRRTSGKMQQISRTSNRITTFLQLLILVILTTHVAVTYEQLTGWSFRLNYQSDTSKSMLAIFHCGSGSDCTTPVITVGQHT